MVRLKVSTFLLIFAIGICAVSTEPRNPLKDPRICGRPECDLEETSKFGYQQNVRYRYSYSMHVKSEFFGGGDNTSDLYLSANVEFTFPKSCEGVLHIKTVEIRDKLDTEEQIVEDDFDYYGEYDPQSQNLHPNSGKLGAEIERNDLRFAFHDGVISEVCPSSNESVWALNFKKGILSAFQNSMLRFDVDLNTTETDVSGTCNVAYNLEGAEGTSVLIHKVKNIDSCTSRYKAKSVLQTTPYNFRDNKAIWPILSATSYCNFTVDHNVYKQVNCVERHLLVPFSNNQTGAVTESEMKFSLVFEEEYQPEYFFSDEDANVITRRSSLLFDHTPTPKPTHNEIKASRDLLKTMCDLGFPNIQRGFIEIFTKFLQTTRLLNYVALNQLLARAEAICPEGRNHVLESLPYIGSVASVQIMRDQMISETVSEQIAKGWMTSLSFMQRPEQEMLQSFYSLIEYGQQKNDPEYILGSSASVYSFCRHHADCGEYEEIRNIVRYLEVEILSGLKRNTHTREIKERVVVLLKGLGNIGIMTEPFVERLKEVIQDEYFNIEVRLQSVLSFRRLSCYRNRNFFLNVYQNFTANSEIRILSYVQSMRCPDFNSIHIIKHVLETEEVNQVGSYVWSQLTNLAKSSSPVRVEAQGLLVDGDLGTKYKLDIRKFSRNFEHSLFFDEYNFGTAVDANIIFGTDSFLPRIASLNFTADLFGESVNFFEISARVQGFEQLAESTFGPKGPLNLDGIRKSVPFLNKIFGDESLEVEGLDEIINFDKLRMRRDVDDDEYDFEGEDDETEYRNLRTKRQEPSSRDQLENKVDQLGYKLKYNYNEPRAALGLKIFGNDLKYYTMDGLLEVLALANELRPDQQLAKLLSGNEIIFTKSGVFMDASYDVPLSSGLPLSVHGFGASSIDLRLSGQLTVDQQRAGKWYFDVEGKLKPSVSADVHTTMQTDFYLASTGIRVKSNLYSSSAVEAKLKVRGSELVSFQFSLPQDRNDIFSAKSELIVITETAEIPQKGIKHRYENSTCTWPILDKAIGLKVCANYSLPDVSSSPTTYPSLLLSGPINLNVYLEKADQTAKTFLFEYQWHQIGNNSKGSFLFETPGSKTPRILTANFTRDQGDVNISMSFRNGMDSHSAVGNYVSNPEDRRLDIYLDTNGRKNLALEMSMNRTVVPHGHIYEPRFLLSINDDRIAGMSGMVKITEKRGIEQDDINLTFETKKLQLRILGYIVRTETSCAVKLKTDYRFQKNQIETVEIEGEIANRSQRTKTEYRGDMKLQTTAYPHFNFASNVTWLSLLSHSEGNLTYNNAPDLQDPSYTTTTRFIFARSQSDDPKSEGYRTTVSFEVIKPRSNIDFRIMFKHEERHKNGPVHNFLCAIRYAPRKEATAVFSAFFPRRSLFAVDASMNITVPAFDSCVARILLIERQPKDYSIDFNGAWFSGDSINVKGTYQDRSSRLRSHHHTKLIVKSSSFNETIINLTYRRNEREIVFDVQVEYDLLPYGLIIRYSTWDENQKITYAEIKFRDKLYWLSSNVTTKQPKMLLVEIHVDKIRDIHLKVKGLSTESKKEALFEIQWDANRDPSQRLAFLAELNKPMSKKYDGTLMLAYPERTFSCNFDIHNRGPDYKGQVRASWSTNEAIVLTYDAGYILDNTHNGWFRADITTPFEGWRTNSLSSGIYYKPNLLLLNASLHWAEEQLVGFAVKGYYEMTEVVLACELKVAINSTIPDIPTGSALIKHKHGVNNVDTNLDFRYILANETLQVYSLRSIWQLMKNHQFRNISGTVGVRTPFEGYKSGGLITKVSLSESKQIEGAATVKLEDRKFTLAVEGHVKKLTDSMLQINITTPIEKFNNIRGQFGLSEVDRHLVAMIQAPAGAFGVEMRFNMYSFTDFNVLFNLATPLDAFQRVELIGTMKPETIDMRVTWNNVTAGFIGIWRMVNLTDFEYSYRVLTPFEGLLDNGVVIKFVKNENFDLEMYMKFSNYKIGLKALGKPKPKLIAQLRNRRLELDFFNEETFEREDLDSSSSSISSEEYFEMDYSELLNYVADFELDTLIFPTIKGNAEVEEIDDYYNTVAKIFLAQGVVDIKDQLYFPDLMNIKNQVKIQTPFASFHEIRSKVLYGIDFKKYYLGGFEVSVFNQNSNKTIEVGLFGNYTITVDEADSKTHDIAVVVKTPFEVLKKIELSGFVELEENNYRGNLTGITGTTKISIGGALESDENFIDASLGLLLETTVVPQYGFHVYFKKDFSSVENSLDMGFDVRDNGTSNKLRVEASWKLGDTDLINGRGQIQTNLLPIKYAETSMLVTRVPNPVALIDFTMLQNNGNRTNFHAKATRKNNMISLEILSPIKEYSNVTMYGILSPMGQSETVHRLTGQLYRNTLEYSVDGQMTFESDVPIHASFTFLPRTGGTQGHVQFSIQNTEGNYGKTYQLSTIEGNKMCQIGGGYSIRTKLDWEFAMLITSSEPEISKIDIKAHIKPKENGRIYGDLQAHTPWRQLGVGFVKIGAVLYVQPESGEIEGNYQLGNIRGRAFCSWFWVLLENMQFAIESVIERGGSNPRVVEALVKYLNPNKNLQHLTAGGKLNVDSKWHLEANTTLRYVSSNDFSVGIVADLPEPLADIHRMNARYRGNILSKDPLDVNVEAKYESDVAKHRFLSRGHYRNVNDMQGMGHVEWGPLEDPQILEGNLQMLRKGQARREFSAKLATPYYPDQGTISVLGNYDQVGIYHKFGCLLNYPESRQVADTDISFSSLSNVEGYVNATTPFLNVTWLRGDLRFATTGGDSVRFLKVTWPENSAYCNLKSKFTSQNLNRDLEGVIDIEVPLQTHHTMKIDYNLRERALLTLGRARVIYNNEVVLNGNYTCNSEQSAGFEKDIIDISLMNPKVPLGIHYVHSSNYTQADLPDYDMKHVQVFGLGNPAPFNLTGEVYVHTTETGQEYKIVAIHPNRTVVITSDYDYLTEMTTQNSKIQLSPTAWFGYHVELKNSSEAEDEWQSFILNVFYPKRNISTEGWYSVTEHALDSNVTVKWTKSPSDTVNDYNSYSSIWSYSSPTIPPKTDEITTESMRAALKWTSKPLSRNEKDNQDALLTIKHPSFAKDITIRANYYRSNVDLFNTNVIVDYADDPAHLLTFGGDLKDHSYAQGYTNYSYKIYGKHIVSELDLNVNGSVSGKPKLYQTENFAEYQRGFLPRQKGLLIGLLDVDEKIIHYHRVSPYNASRIWGHAHGSYPIYGFNASILKTPNINTTGYFFINLKDKYTRAAFNMTPDASHNLQMVGSIPDARSSYFDLWRNYEEIRVIDISYYLRMNHSRLVTSQLHWRPKLKEDIKNQFRGLGGAVYETFSNGVDFWIKTVYTETKETINDVWSNAKPHTQQFLTDIGGLTVLEKDFIEFRTFLNESYEANDFYIKTAVNFTLTVIDELAIRDHIQSLPKIFSEIWHVMGNSGKALRESILWLIETIKTSYHKALDMISKFLHGESLDHLSKLIETGITKYDKMVKDLHLSLIKYVENMWNKFATTAANYWKTMLHKIEPHVLRFLHYIETAAWNLSKEMFDFLYERTNELAESPYFNQVSSFTQDLDHLYKDLMANDAITNFRKYSGIIWDFVTEKYFKLVPFGKELSDVLTELWEELKKLQEMDSIRILLQKVHEVKEKLGWLAEEFELEKRLHQLWALFRNKIMSYTQTALEADDRYREAKTKFIFDPDAGILELEQKLPMSWHAFNDTPKFEEIPEYKTLIDIQNFFSGSNFTLWNYVYEFKTNVDPKTWFPPYKSHSLMIGSRHYMTFDRRFVGLNLRYEELSTRYSPPQCSYLLAHDFFNRNFTLILEPSVLRTSGKTISTRKYTLVIEKDIIEIDVTADTLRIGRNPSAMLPVVVGDVTIARDSDVLTIESTKDFILSCNLQFDLCWFELGGWYFGQTAGILGTMNNEPFDDYTGSNGHIIQHEESFVNSWELQGCEQHATHVDETQSVELMELCGEFFKTAYFSNCNPILDPNPFYEMCLDLGGNSISTVLRDNHPAQKGACTAALAYIEACAALKIPLRIPDKCVHCDVPHRSYVPEGSFVELKGNDVPRTTDVVFIVEAKPCNQNITTTKSMMAVVNLLDKELNDVNITNNRYAVVAFGGRVPFDKPRSIVYNNQVFTNSSNLKHYFDHIEAHNSNNSDIFQAISVASKLIFRPGASKTFILLPCSECLGSDMRFDYSSLLQLMLEEGINLHILMDKDFVFDKARLNKIFFGMDRELAYTKRDLKEFKGDAELRKQVRSSKEGLGLLCIPLAMETNGAVFTARKLRPGKNPVKKLAEIFAKRVAKTAVPSPCQQCECTGHNTGVAYMTCTSCDVPSPGMIDYDFDESGKDINWDWDWDDEKDIDDNFDGQF